MGQKPTRRGTSREQAPKEPSSAHKRSRDEKEAGDRSEALKTWPYVGSSRSPRGPVDKVVQDKLAIFKPKKLELGRPDTSGISSQPRHKLFAGESVFEEASVACRVADNAFVKRDREALGNADPTQLVDTVIWSAQQISAMGVTLRSVVDESAGRLARQETAARQEREKLHKEIDRHIQRANEAEKKTEDALRFRQIAEDKSNAVEKRLAKVEGKLKKSLAATKDAEQELARLVETRAEELEQARHQIETEYAQTKVKPALGGMRQRSYQKGFREAIALVVSQYPGLPEDVRNLDVTFEGDEVLITGGVEIISKGGVPPVGASGGDTAQSPRLEENAENEEQDLAAADRMRERAEPTPTTEEGEGPKEATPVVEGTVEEEEGNGNSESGL